jgi:hypothetical protein
MYDLASYSPAYPHARYGHSTSLLTENYLLLYGGCLRYYIITKDMPYYLSSIKQSNNTFVAFLVVTEKEVHVHHQIHGY